MRPWALNSQAFIGAYLYIVYWNSYAVPTLIGCVRLLPVRAKAKIRGNKYGATRSAGDYQRKVQLARL